MPRKTKRAKPLIYVFCEGETEQCYVNYLRNTFSDVAVIKAPVLGLFKEAISKFDKEAQYRNAAEATDEIWFFFDTDDALIPDWNKNLRIIKRLRNLRRDKIRVRLLMTSGCVEYWFLLHFAYCCPPCCTVPEKDRLLSQVQSYCTSYKKGDQQAVNEIAKHYAVASENAARSLQRLSAEGLPGLEDTDLRNEWLYKSTLTFSTVQKAIDFLVSLHARA